MAMVCFYCHSGDTYTQKTHKKINGIFVSKYKTKEYGWFF